MHEFKAMFDSELLVTEKKSEELEREEIQFAFFWETTNKRLFDEDL